MENSTFARNSVMNEILERGTFEQIDNGSVLFEAFDKEGNVKFVEVRFIVKNNGFDANDAVNQFKEKQARAAKRLAEAEANKKEK